MRHAKEMPARSKMVELSVDSNYEYKGFAINASARQINHAPNEAWRPMYRINGKDQSQAWTPRDRSVVYATEKTAIAEAGKRAEWMIDNSAPTLRSP